MTFNLEQARQDGIPDSAIAQRLSERHGFDYATAKTDGVPDGDIIDHLVGREQPQHQVPDGIDRQASVEALVQAPILGVGASSLYRDREVVKKIRTREAPGFLGRVKQSWDIGKAHNELGVLRYRQLLGEGGLDEQIEKVRGSIPTSEEYYPAEFGLLEKSVRANAEMLPVSIESIRKGLKRGLALGAGGAAIAAIAGQTGPQVLAPEEIATVPGAFLALGSVGAASGAFDHISQIEAGLAYDELLSIKDSEGNTIDPTIAKASAHGVGVVNGIIELAQIKLIMSTIPGGKKLLSGAINAVTKKVLTGDTLKKVALRNSVKYAGVVTAEVAQEIAQESTNIVAGELAKELNNRLLGTGMESAEAKEIIDRLVETGKQAGLAFGGLALPGTVTTAVIEGAEVTAQPVEQTDKVKPESPPETETAITPKADVTPQVQQTQESEIEHSYESLKDTWFADRDERLLYNSVEKQSFQDSIKRGTGQKKYNDYAKDIDKAIHLHIDTKRNPSHATEFFGKLTDEQKRIVQLSQNLPEWAQEVANDISESYTSIGLEAQDADVIANVLDNYAARVWDLGEKRSSETGRKFGTTSRHAKQRSFDTIIEGWAGGYNLKVEGATNNLHVLRDEMVRTLENKRFLKNLMKIKTKEGDLLVTDHQLDGYVKIKHPNFSAWKWAGRAEAGKTYGRNFIVTKKGDVLERRSLYAPKKVAKNLNNILGTSGLKGVPGFDTITKYNAVFKSWILQSSLFHHLAFMRSFYLGTNKKTWAEMNGSQSYKNGLRAIKDLHEDVVLGVRNGLTLGLRQDWEETLLQEKTIIGKMLDKTKATKEVKDILLSFRQMQADFLFGELGAGLKAKSFMIEFRNEVAKHPNENRNVIAKRVASLINDDFGGLHLERLGRNPTLQHIFRIFALAPDWTESNIRTMVKTITNKSGSKAERQLYRRFWTGIALKGAAATVLANYALAGGDIDELLKNYREAWRSGNMRWMAVDVTPIYKMFGGKGGSKKYFSMVGHFKDPSKFIAHPLRSLHHKGSVVYGIAHEALAGTDWAGRRFTTMEELLKDGETVKWGPGKPIDYDTFPSYALSQIIGTQPIQVQNLIGWMSGEMDGFDSIANSMGLGVTSTAPKGRSAGRNKAR